jgi:circadian clock protein KaiC
MEMRAANIRRMGLERASTGLAGLDDLIEGGFPANRVILVRGQAGSGKTTLGLQFLMEGVERGEPGVLVSVDQKPQHVIEEAAQFGWDLAEASARGMLSVLDASRYFSAARVKSRFDPRQVASDLTGQVRHVGAKRMVIDSLTALVPDGSDSEVHDFLRSLFFSLEDSLGCTVVVTFWNPGAPPYSHAWTVAEFMASGVLDLQTVKAGDRIGRVLAVRKMRGTETVAVERPFEIRSDRGIVVRGPTSAFVPPSPAPVEPIAPAPRPPAPVAPPPVIPAPVAKTAPAVAAPPPAPAAAPPAPPPPPPTRSVADVDALLAGLKIGTSEAEDTRDLVEDEEDPADPRDKRRGWAWR